MELRRSRRLAGLEPDVFHEEEHVVAADEEVELRHTALVDEVQQAVVCSKILSGVVTFLATLTLGRTVVAVACAPGYCLF